MKNQNRKHRKGWSTRHLPSDLYPEILCRLPVKSLLRFRCVSKSWLALVDEDRNFARLHLATFKNNSDETHLFFDETRFGNGALACYVRSSDTLETISEMPFSLQNIGFIVSSVDGVVLMKQYGTGSSYKLWNPSLRRSFDVEPPPPVGHNWKTVDFGFGYDPLAKDYKIVTIICNYVSKGVVQYSVGIYTVGIGSWKIIPLPDWQKYSVYTNVVYLQGSLYLFAKDGHNFTTWHLLSFDLSNDVFSTICSFDEAYFKSSSFLGREKLVLVGDRFYVPMFGSNSSGKSVWVLERETLNWTKYCKCSSENIRVLYVKKNGDVLNSWEGLVKDDLLLYSPGKHEYKILHGQRSSNQSPNQSPSVRVFAYVESLILHQCNMNRKKGV